MVYGLFFNLTYKRCDIFPKPIALHGGRHIPCCCVPKCCEKNTKVLHENFLDINYLGAPLAVISQNCRTQQQGIGLPSIKAVGFGKISLLL